MDTLTISGVSPKYDGVYELDIFGMIADVSSPVALTGDEACYIQDKSGVRGNELISAFLAGDFKFLMALTVVVLAREGKNLDVGVLMKQKVGAYRFELAAATEDDPAHPSREDEPSPTTSLSSGTSSPSALESLEVDPVATGVPV